MKKVFSYGRWFFTGLALLVLSFTFAAAQSPTDPGTLGTPCYANLMAGKAQVVYGDMVIWNTSTTLYIQLRVSGSNIITESHVAVGCDLSDIPVNPSGTPVPGQFPLHNDLTSQTHTYSVLLADLPCSQVFIAAHGVLYCASKNQEETMWGYCAGSCGSCLSLPFPNTKRWSYYLVYTIQQ
jgi:hypothetical protein